MLENGILKELIEGDKDAFTNLYFKYSGQIYSNILRLTKCEETSQEILQELFLKVWEKRAQIDLTKPFKAYLFTIAQNLMYDHFRKVARDKILTENLVHSAAIYYRPSEESGVFEERLECVNKAIEQLPAVRKQVFKLCKIEGKSYEEIASLLEISTSTISDHIVKANRAIRKYLQMHGDVAISLFIWILIDLS
ncbi:RNA polymerase sigma factor [Dyadobacter frigoris]|uniref:RNA polymerase sigma factor n=1 Tax=Dyadobacter frigoris TaxID=2576211 RepID=A0A4U6CYU4_9BACT|nr:RNA polymerase sigma factor [Dyadobacter frigoris]TKT88951.1 RNA polymerase sigma factor [Dyadobacter frigoris]